MNPFVIACYARASRLIGRLEQRVTPLFDLALRLYLAQVFFRSGWLKLTDWSATLYLFDDVYRVPLLAPHVAAVMGTAGEVGLSVLLVIGIASRFAAVGLFVTNLTAAISFPDLSDLGRQDHILWGALLLVLVFHGAGRLALDYWLAKRVCLTRSSE